MQSKNFNMDISLDELIKHNKTCKIDLNSTHHFETYEGILIYVSHPEGKEKFSIQLGVDEDGIMYEGDYRCRAEFKEIPVAEGINILLKYRELIGLSYQLEYFLLKNELDKTSVYIQMN